MIICPVCNSSDARVFDRRDRVSILQNRLYDTAQSARQAPTGRLEMAACNECSFVWNAAFDSKLMNYDPSYENDQSKSAVFKEHLQQRIVRILEAFDGRSNHHIVEVGCGQGDFLGQLAAFGDAGRIRLTGFDPAWRGNDLSGPGGSRIFRSIFSDETAKALDVSPDAIVSRHTIEHIPDPVGFLVAIRRACGDRQVKLFLETPCASWILDKLQFQDLFYEHCSIFTEASLSRALEKAGLVPDEIKHVFGGQYLWAEATVNGSSQSFPWKTPALAVDRWIEEKSHFVAKWTEKIELAAKSGPVFVWGVGAKGVTFALLTDPNGTRLAGAVDLNPKKQSRHIPLTGIGVIAPSQLPTSPFTAIVMNPNYFGEISDWLIANGRKATLLSIAD